jgi:hypothetical protein
MWGQFGRLPWGEKEKGRRKAHFVILKMSFVIITKKVSALVNLL